MLKAGRLPAPIIQPLRCDSIGTRVKAGPNTYIEIRSDVAGTRIYFTTDGTKPDPFQKGRTGRESTHKYVGPFRLQVGNRVVKAIAITRDRLRESPVSTRYIDVVSESVEPYYLNSDHELNEYSYSDEEQPQYQFLNSYQKRNSNDYVELQGSVDGPINPINYSGTQINVWGFPAPDMGTFFNKKEPQPAVGYLTEQMIKNLNTPRENERPPNDRVLPETLRKFFKQIQKFYERDSDFQNSLDFLIENAQLKSIDISENYDAFNISANCPKFLVDEPIHRPKPVPIKKPRPPSPPIQVYEPPKIQEKPRYPSPPPPPQKIIEEPARKEEPSVYIEENQVIKSTFVNQQGTLVDSPNFNAEKDSEKLKKAVKGLGTNEKVIIEIMGNRSNAQRLKIKDVYKAMFGKELAKDLESDTSGNFKKLLVALLMSPVEYDCMEMRKAVQGLGTDNSVLIEILTSRSNKRLKEISQLYTQLYKKKLEDDVISDTSGAYRKLLVSLLTASRPEMNEVDMNLVRKDVDELVQAGIKKLGTDEAKFNVIFGTRSFAHLRQMFEEYQRKTGKAIEDSIKNEMSGNLAKTYIALINNIKSRPGYFAKQIKKAIKGLGTDEHTLNRIIISRSEIDMIQIKNEYKVLFKNDMIQDIKGDVSGDYGLLLIEILKDPSERVYDSEVTGPEEPHVVEEVEEPKIEETPTLYPVEPFNANDDCESLRKAMKGFGTDEKTIIEIISKRSNSQRQELKRVYKQMHGRDLLKDLQSELSGDFKSSIEALMMASNEFDAYCLKKAISGLGTDDSALIEILTTRTNEQLNTAKSAYQSMYGKSLEAEIKSDTSGKYKNVLVSLLTATRPSSNMVDRTQAKIDAQALLKAGVKSWGTDESKFVSILCTQSYSQLRGLFEQYALQSGSTLEKDIEKEISGDLKKVLLAIIACVKDKQAYFASLLYKAIKGIGTKEEVLTRVIVSRCEVDMVQIKHKFEVLYKTKFADFLKGDVSGDYSKVLFNLIGEESYVKK